ncbi:PREDICTED: E3 ubiquitin-protein ligase Praja-1-like [Camelina sativa]|uniref:RING-type E3 ubiquitin transferase n=1 Tax=Camelina sativa TaxID=90675 RepID=A0ABM0XXJ4_CAMSA|nr:PREDICTED: E3 ubiquitin-protein ligase Praja-1-like [Camelina sativa]
MSTAKLFGCAITVEADEERRGGGGGGGGGGDGGSSIAVEVPRSQIQTDCNPYYHFLDSNSDSGSASMDDAEPEFIDFFHRESYEVDTVRDFCICSNQSVINSTSSGGFGFNIWEEDIELGLGIGSRSGSGDDSLVHREIDLGRVEVVAPVESDEPMVVDEEFEWENLHNAIEWVQEPVQQQVTPPRADDDADVDDDDDNDDDDDAWQMWNANVFFQDMMDMDHLAVTFEDDDAAILVQMFDNQDDVIMGSPAASKRVVDDLPAVVITSEQLSNGNTIVCAICKDDIVVDEKAKRLPCKHYYHGECIVPWLGIRNTCPVCRYELPTDDPEYERNRKMQRRGSNGLAR